VSALPYTAGICQTLNWSFENEWGQYGRRGHHSGLSDANGKAWDMWLRYLTGKPLIANKNKSARVSPDPVSTTPTSTVLTLQQRHQLIAAAYTLAKSSTLLSDVTKIVKHDNVTNVTKNDDIGTTLNTTTKSSSLSFVDHPSHLLSHAVISIDDYTATKKQTGIC
jgi:hypothetical protein